MTIKSYEDWTPPKFLQGEDGELDSERIKLEFFKRERDNAKYRRTNANLKLQLEDASEQDDEEDGEDGEDGNVTVHLGGEKLPVKKQKKGEGQGPSLNEIRLEIALEKGLTKSQAMRLHGNTAEELQADADVYMEENGIVQDAPEQEDPEQDSATPPPRQTPRRHEVKSGSQRDDGGEPTWFDPAVLMDHV